MFSKFSPAFFLVTISIAAMAGLIGTLYWTRDGGNPGSADNPLEFYCAAAMRLPMQEIAADYEKETGQKVVIHLGPSQTILATMEISKKGDLFLPADESYVRLAKDKGLVDEVTHLATMQAVVIVRPGFPSEIKTWDDFLAKGVKLGLPNPESTAIGKLTKAELERTGKWAAVEARQPSYLGDINEVGNSVVNIGSSDAGIVFDAIAFQLQQKKPDMKIVKLNALENVKAQIQIALTKNSSQPGNARRFVDFIRDKAKGAPILAKHGYSDIESAAVADQRPDLKVFAGSMLHPAIEQSLKDFEKRENVKITTVYNGCGILVAQMKTGAVPDIYFACDTTFMQQVKDKFEQPSNVSNNQLMIIVKKGNPKDVHRLRDLGKPGLKVGVGHEQQCAMGALTKETFTIAGVYGRVVKNVVVTSPTGDYLVNQMIASGGLDVVIAYRSNWLPFKDKLDAVPIEDIPCAAPSQPIAVSKSSTHPELSRRLMDFLQTEQSRQRFEKSGFGWEKK